MKLTHLYAALCVAGTLLPVFTFIPFLRDHGVAVALALRQLFSTPLGGFFGMDVIVSTATLWLFVSVEGRRVGIRHAWAPIAASLTVGVSLGLPLFLLMREAHLRGERRFNPR